MAIYETNTLEKDGLIGGPELPLLEANVTITAGKAMARGTLITVTDGKGAATAKAGVADGILAYDVDAAATVATIYTAGRFNREKVIVATGDTVAAHEAELRAKGIVFTSLK